MGWLQQIFDAVRNLFKWWFIVLPWEQSIRVRIGRHVRVFGAGIHFQIPFIDKLYVQNTRMRITPLSPQTLTTLDGRTITCAGSLRFRLFDVLRLYQTLHQAEETIRQHAEGLLADYVIRHNLADCAPSMVADHVTAKLDLSQYGLNDSRLFLTDFAVVKTYRLIGGNLERYARDGIDTVASMAQPGRS